MGILNRFILMSVTMFFYGCLFETYKIPPTLASKIRGNWKEVASESDSITIFETISDGKITIYSNRQNCSMKVRQEEYRISDDTLIVSSPDSGYKRLIKINGDT